MNTSSPNSNFEYFSSNMYGKPHRATNMFIRFIVVILLGLGAGIIFNLSKGNYFVVVLNGVCVVLVSATLLLVRRKRFELAATILAVTLLSLVTIAVTYGQGIRQVSVLAYPAILIISSLVVRKRTMVLITIYNIVCVAWLMLGEYFGIFTPAIPARSTPGEFVIVVVILAITAFMVRLITEALFDNNLLLQKELAERERAEQELKSFQELMRYIIEHSNSAVAVHDRDLRYIYVSQRYLEQYKIKERDIIGKHHYDVFPDLPQKWRDVHQKALEGEVSGANRDPYYRADGTVEWTRWECRPWYGANGVIGGIIVYTEVITDRVRTEESLRENLFRQSAILDNIPDLAWLKDEESRFIAVNEPFSQACGMSSEDLVGKTDLDIWPEELAQAYRKDDFEVMRTGKRRDVEERLVDGTGRESWIQTIKTPIFDDSGQLIGTAGIARDITERKQMDSKVLQLTRLYATLSQVNQTIVRTKSSDELYQAICQIAIGHGRFSLAWIGLLNPTSGVVTPVAQAGSSGDYVQNLNINLNDETTGSGPTGMAIRTGKLVVNDDVLSNPAMAPWRTEASKYNYRSSVAIPFRLKGETIGSLNLYSTEASFFSAPEELGLLEEISVDISFALDNLAIEAERMQMEESLRESEIRYRAIVEGTSDLICRFLPDTTLTFVNTAYCQYFGKDSSELVGMRFLEMIPREGWGAVQEQVNSIIFKQEPYTYEHEVVSPTGEIRWQQWTDSPILNDSGQVVELQSVGRDITESKVAEKALQESERRFREMLQGVELAGVMLDEAGRITFINEFLLHITGWSQEETLGANWFDKFLPEELREGIRSAFDRLMAGEQAMPHYENEILTCRAERRLIRWNNTVLFDSNGKIIGSASIGEDITERKQAEEVLRENQTLLATSQAIAHVGSWDLELPTQRLAWSDEVYRIFGVEPQEFDGTQAAFFEAVHPDDRAAVGEAYWSSLEQGRDSFEIEHRLVRKHIGEIRHVHEKCIHVRDAAGAVVRSLGMVQDITERKQAEDALRLSEERYRILAQNLPDSALLLYDQDLRFIIADGPEIDATGFSREILEGNTLHEALPAEFAQLVEPNMRRALAGERFYAELPYEDRLYRYSYVPLRDNTGNIVRAMILATNITQLKKTEEALKDSQRRLSTALRATKVGVWEWDMRTNKAYWSDENYRVLGLEPRSVESRYENWAKCLHPDDLSAAEAKVAEALNGGGTLNIEFRVIWPDGGIHWVNDIGELLVDQDTGQPLGMYGIQMDVTERKHAEVEREKLIFELERKNIESEILRESAAAVAYPLEFNETVSRILDQLKRAVPYDSASIHLLLGNEVELIGGRGFPEGRDPLGMRFVLDEGDPAYPVLRDGLPYVLYPNVQLVSDRFKGFFHEHIFSWMAIPLYARGRLTGMIAADGFSIDKFTEEHAHFALTFANQVAVTLENARLFEQLQEEKERAEVTLHSIGDAVITASVDSKVKYLNPVAENLTGWRMEEAVGQPLENVFRIVEEVSRQPAVNPVERCLREDRIVGLANHTILIRRDGREFSIDDSAAPIRNHNLEVVGIVLVFHDVTEERRLSRQVAHDAMHDSLTGLVNRREFEKRLERALMNTKEHKTSHILCYLDLDQFKIVNDTAGHAAGDELLKQISDLLVGLFRQRDTIARLGGDEFGLLLENCQLDRALIIANEIRAKIRNFPFVWAGHGFQVGVSIGVVPITPEKESVNQLLSQADIACYSAKDLGRDRIYVYHTDDSETTQRHSGILQAARMRDAILNDQFRLFCQPIVHVTEEEGFLQYEVLLRMADRDGSLVLPGAFIPPAERYGLMHSIDRWVIRKTLLTMTEHDIQRMLVNINLSGNSLDDETLLKYVLDQLNEFSIPAGHICFEITETAAIHHLSKAQQFIHAFRGRGGRIALDDFGSGFSSFRYLKTLPVDYIKIDGSFVSDMLSNPGDLLMVEAITQIAHTLGIKVIAEHASNTEIINRLREIGVERAQGFGIGLPIPVEEAWERKE